MNSETRTGLNKLRRLDVKGIIDAEKEVMKSMHPEYKIRRVNAAMVHEGHCLSEQDLQTLKDCIDCKTSVADAKAAVFAKYCREKS